MKLKDCPVGSIVQCVRWSSSKEIPSNACGEFTVKNDGEENFFTDNDGIKWFESECENDEYEIVSQPDAETQKTKKIYFKGKSYTLTPVPKSDVIEIDGVEYYMEPV